MKIISDPLSFSIRSGNIDNTFSINEDSGELTLSAMLDFDVLSTYSLVVEVTDGENSTSANIRVDVILNEVPF